MIPVDAPAASERDAAAMILDVGIQSAANVMVETFEKPVIDIRKLELVTE